MVVFAGSLRVAVSAPSQSHDELVLASRTFRARNLERVTPSPLLDESAPGTVVTVGRRRPDAE